MSEFSDKQKNECEEIEQPSVQEEFCPSCIPDPYSPRIDWTREQEPYFDPRTCEFIANVSFHKAQDVFQNGIEISIDAEENVLGLDIKKTFSSLREYAESQRKRGTEILLKHFGKKVNEEFLSLSFIPEDGIHVSNNSVINLKIVIVAERFNAIGELRAEDLTEEQPENNTNFPDTLTIDDSRFELWEKLITTNLGILAYEAKYSYFRTVDDGVIKYDRDGELVFFKPKDIRDSLNDLKQELDKILSTNKMTFYSISSFFGIYDTVTELEIQFDHSDPEKPFKIHKVFATSGNCPRTELFKGLPSFKENAYLPTALFYMTNFEKAYSDITSPQPRDWLEFFEEYTYPPIEVIYGSSGSEEKLEESGLSCALDIDLGKLSAGLLEDFFHSAWDLFSNSFDLVACSDDPIDREPALKEFLRPDSQQKFEDIYKRELKKLRKERDNLLLETPAEDNLHAHTEDPEFLRKIAEENEKADSVLRQRAQQRAETAVSNMEKKNFLHPFYKHFESSLKERFKNDQNVLAVFKKIQKETGLTASAKIEKFIQSIGMCGISKGFKKSLDCFMKQFDLKTLITSAVKTFLKGFSIQDLSNTLRDLLFFLPADKQIEVQLKIEEKLGNIKPPWETFTTNPDEISLKEERKVSERLGNFFIDKDGKILTEKIDGVDTPIVKGALGSKTNKFNIDEKETLGTEFSEGIDDTINQSAELILETYLEELLGATTVEELISKYKKEIPVLEEILKLFPTDCKTSPIKSLNMSLLPDYKFDICNPTIPMTLVKLPELKWKPNPWKILKSNMKKTIREAILKAITALVTKLINLLEEKLCESLEFLGKSGIDLLSGKDVDFGGILKDAFCPDASDDEVRDLGNSLLNKIGAKDTDIQNAFDCFSGAIFGSMTQRELIDLITLKDKNPVDIKMFIQTIKVGCPNMFDLVNTPNKAENFFNNIGNLIPQDTRQLLQESIPFSSDGVPFYDSICLTSDELRAWDQLRRQGLEGSGLSPEDAADQVDLYNRRARDTLEDIMDIINNGPGNDIDDMIQDLFSPLSDDPCDKKSLKEGESLFGNKMAREPEELVLIQNDVSNRIFDGIIDQVTRDFSNSLFLNGSFLERILTDTRDNNQALHNLYKTWILSRNKYHDSETTQQQKSEKFAFFGLDFTGEHRGYYPETVGLYCKEQLESNSINYDSNVNIIEIKPRKIFENFNVGGQEINIETPKKTLEEPAFELSFEREYSGPGASFAAKKVEGGISFLSGDLKTADKTLGYKIRSKYEAEVSYQDLAYNEISSDGLETLSIENDENTEYRALVFNAFINKKLESLISKPNISNINNFSNAIEKIFSDSIKMILDNTEGFQLGFEDETLTEEDLTYVNPEEGSTEYTFDNEDKVLGRSKTNHPRVTFLNPEKYGGSYKVPPVYIEPKKMHGWMKYSKDLFPEEEECEPKTQTIINGGKIKAFINDRRNSAPLKNREMERMSEKCYFNKPFDKPLTKNALPSIEGLIKIQIRTSIVKEMIKSMPAISCLKYKTGNYDMSSSQTILNRLVEELKTVNPFGAYKLERQNYYLIFLEQAVQYFISTTVAELPDKINPETGEMTEKDFSGLSAELETAYKKIKSFSDGFSYSNIIVPENGRVRLLGTENVDSTILSSDQYNQLAGVYQDVGDYMFNSNSTYDYSKDFAQSEATTNLYSVIFAVRLCEKEAKIILKHMIDKEYEELMSDFYKRENTIIEDISKAILTSTELFEENQIENFGFTQYEEKISVGSFQSMGQPNNVVDTTEIDPFSSTDDFKMKIEKYIRIHEKEQPELPEEVMEVLNSRDHNLKGVVSLENLQSFLNDNAEILGEYNISDLFGDASISDDVMSGSIGMKIGIRIVARLPNVSPQPLDFRDINFSKHEKAYYIKNDSQIISIPITSAEVEIIDRKIKDLNLEEVYDVDCLARKMTNSDDYKMFFMKIIPLQAASSMALQYFNYFFLDSIGLAANERDEEISNPNRIKMPEFNGTNLQIRKYFASFYNSNRGLHFENFNLPKIEFPDFWKMLFGNISFPQINVKLLLPNGVRFDHKVVKINPYNRNDEICNQ